MTALVLQVLFLFIHMGMSQLHRMGSRSWINSVCNLIGALQKTAYAASGVTHTRNYALSPRRSSPSPRRSRPSTFSV
jgi:hypothetical protein